MANDDLAKIVDSNNVLDSPEILEAYSEDMSFVPKLRPRCVVKPNSADKV